MNLSGVRSLILFAFVCHGFTDMTVHCKILQGQYGCLASPSYPNKYQNNLNVTDEILVPAGKKVHLKCHSFKVEGGYSCPFDYLQIFDGDKLGVKYCGDRNLTEFISTSNRVLLNFRTDSSVTESGYFVTYVAVENSQPPVNGEWCSWGSWSACTSSCGAGLQTRSRACSCPSPRNNGLSCIGQPTYSISCNNGACPSPTPTAPPGEGAKVNNVRCGITKVQQSRVIGGKDAANGAWPWQIGMYYNGMFVCGGSLINAKWVLTAAHCISTYGVVDQPTNYTVKVGDLDRYELEDNEKSYQVEKLIMHPNYNDYNISCDIALMKLSTPVMYNEAVNTVCVPNKTDTVDVGSRCFITGWGKIQSTGYSHHKLQQAMLPVLDSAKCREKLQKSPILGSLNVTKEMVCAGEESSVKSGCHGDSGGPFVCADQNGRYYIHGAVSWGSPNCNTTEAFTVFARVTMFRDWIDQTLSMS